MSKQLRLLYQELRFHQERNRITVADLCAGCRRVRALAAAIRLHDPRARRRVRAQLKKRTLL